MPLARSKITSQGQISIPLDVRRKLGVGPGSLLEWDEDGGNIVVRRVAQCTSEDIHRVLFPEGKPARKTIAQMKAGIEQYIREKHARR